MVDPRGRRRFADLEPRISIVSVGVEASIGATTTIVPRFWRRFAPCFSRRGSLARACLVSFSFVSDTSLRSVAASRLMKNFKHDATTRKAIERHARRSRR